MGNDYNDEDLLARIVDSAQRKNGINTTADEYAARYGSKERYTAGDKIKHHEESSKNYRNIKNKSSRNVKPVPCSRRQKPSKEVKEEKVSLVKKVATGIIIGIVVAGTIITIGIGKNKIQDNKDVAAGKEMLVSAMEEKFESLNLGYYDENNEFRLNNNNTKEDYKKADIDTILEYYTAQNLIQDSWDKKGLENQYMELVQGTEINLDGGTYYTDTSQFLRINGFFDEDGQTSREVFNNYMEAEILELYRNGLLEDFCNEQLVSNSKGGITK